MKIVRIDPSVAIVTRPKCSDDVTSLLALVRECLASQAGGSASASSDGVAICGPLGVPAGVFERSPAD